MDLWLCHLNIPFILSPFDFAPTGSDGTETSSSFMDRTATDEILRLESAPWTERSPGPSGFDSTKCYRKGHRKGHLNQEVSKV